jgi:O-antigen/teichoic acid export membrane protein
MINAGMGSVGLILNMTGNEKDTLKGHIIAALVNIILNLVLIPYFGINGAAWATAVSMICWNLILGLLVFKRLGIWAHAIG